MCHFPSASEAWKESEKFLPFEKLSFNLDRVYVLTRPSNDPENLGQFGVAYTLLLGRQSVIPIHENGKRFDSMPKEKFQWIKDAEKEYKKASKWNKKRRKNKKSVENKSDVSESTSIESKRVEKFDVICKVLAYLQSFIPSSDELWL